MRRLVTALAITAGLAAPAIAQTPATGNMEILRQKMRADKKLLIAQNLKLTDAEGAAFWPVYDAYQKDIEQLNQRMTKVILAYADAYNKGPVTNEAAKKLLDEVLVIDEAETTLKSSSAKKVLAVLPAAKAARYVQIENKIRAAVRYELAAGIPLVE
jgi:hypothetical protein